MRRGFLEVHVAGCVGSQVSTHPQNPSIGDHHPVCKVVFFCVFNAQAANSWLHMADYVSLSLSIHISIFLGQKPPCRKNHLARWNTAKCCSWNHQELIAKSPCCMVKSYVSRLNRCDACLNLRFFILKYPCFLLQSSVSLFLSPFLLENTGDFPQGRPSIVVPGSIALIHVHLSNLGTLCLQWKKTWF